MTPGQWRTFFSVPPNNFLILVLDPQRQKWFWAASVMVPFKGAQPCLVHCFWNYIVHIQEVRFEVLVAEAPWHRQEQRTQSLTVRLLKTLSFSLIQYWTPPPWYSKESRWHHWFFSLHKRLPLVLSHFYWWSHITDGLSSTRRLFALTSNSLP